MDVNSKSKEINMARGHNIIHDPAAHSADIQTFAAVCLH